jgi:alpha-beta hydrolase superfamily lysophospholipase
MMRSEYAFLSRDGLILQAYAWAPTGKPRGVIVLTHGHGEYAAKYAHVAEAFNARGLALVNYDVRGHGRSGGPRGHAPKYEALLSDLQRVVARAHELYPDLPLFLYGHSFGGQITLNFVIQRKPAVHGVIVSAPWLRLKFQPSVWKLRAARALAGLVPGFTQDTGLEAAVPMTHDQALLAAYPDPHLAHGKMSARLGVDALAAGEQALARAGEIAVPILILHGADDGVFDPDCSRQLFDRVSTRNKALCVYPGLYHEIHNEIGREQVFADIAAWIEQRLDH